MSGGLSSSFAGVATHLVRMMSVREPASLAHGDVGIASSQKPVHILYNKSSIAFRRAQARWQSALAKITYRKTHADKTAYISSDFLLHRLPPHRRAAILQHLRPRFFPRDTWIFEEGQCPSFVYFLISGSVELSTLVHVPFDERENEEAPGVKHDRKNKKDDYAILASLSAKKVAAAAAAKLEASTAAKKKNKSGVSDDDSSDSDSSTDSDEEFRSRLRRHRHHRRRSAHMHMRPRTAPQRRPQSAHAKRFASDSSPPTPPHPSLLRSLQSKSLRVTLSILDAPHSLFGEEEALGSLALRRSSARAGEKGASCYVISRMRFRQLLLAATDDCSSESSSSSHHHAPHTHARLNQFHQLLLNLQSQRLSLWNASIRSQLELYWTRRSLIRESQPLDHRSRAERLKAEEDDERRRHAPISINKSATSRIRRARDMRPETLSARQRNARVYATEQMRKMGIDKAHAHTYAYATYDPSDLALRPTSSTAHPPPHNHRFAKTGPPGQRSVFLDEETEKLFNQQEQLTRKKEMEFAQALDLARATHVAGGKTLSPERKHDNSSVVSNAVAKSLDAAVVAPMKSVASAVRSDGMTRLGVVSKKAAYRPVSASEIQASDPNPHAIDNISDPWEVPSLTSSELLDQFLSTKAPRRLHPTTPLPVHFSDASSGLDYKIQLTPGARKVPLDVPMKNLEEEAKQFARKQKLKKEGAVVKEREEVSNHASDAAIRTLSLDVLVPRYFELPPSAHAIAFDASSQLAQSERGRGANEPPSADEANLFQLKQSFILRRPSSARRASLEKQLMHVVKPDLSFNRDHKTTIRAEAKRIEDKRMGIKSRPSSAHTHGRPASAGTNLQIGQMQQIRSFHVQLAAADAAKQAAIAPRPKSSMVGSPGRSPRRLSGTPSSSSGTRTPQRPASATSDSPLRSERSIAGSNTAAETILEDSANSGNNLLRASFNSTNSRTTSPIPDAAASASRPSSAVPILNRHMSPDRIALSFGHTVFEAAVKFSEAAQKAEQQAATASMNQEEKPNKPSKLRYRKTVKPPVPQKPTAAKPPMRPTKVQTARPRSAAVVNTSLEIDTQQANGVSRRTKMIQSLSARVKHTEPPSSIAKFVDAEGSVGEAQLDELMLRKILSLSADDQPLLLPKEFIHPAPRKPNVDDKEKTEEKSAEGATVSTATIRTVPYFSVSRPASSTTVSNQAPSAQLASVQAQWYRSERRIRPRTDFKEQVKQRQLEQQQKKQERLEREHAKRMEATLRLDHQSYSIVDMKYESQNEPARASSTITSSGSNQVVNEQVVEPLAPIIVIEAPPSAPTVDPKAKLDVVIESEPTSPEPVMRAFNNNNNNNAPSVVQVREIADDDEDESDEEESHMLRLKSTSEQAPSISIPTETPSSSKAPVVPKQPLYSFDPLSPRITSVRAEVSQASSTPTNAAASPAGMSPAQRFLRQRTLIRDSIHSSRSMDVTGSKDSVAALSSLSAAADSDSPANSSVPAAVEPTDANSPVSFDVNTPRQRHLGILPANTSHAYKRRQASLQQQYLRAVSGHIMREKSIVSFDSQDQDVMSKSADPSLAGIESIASGSYADEKDLKKRFAREQRDRDLALLKRQPTAASSRSPTRGGIKEGSMASSTDIPTSSDSSPSTDVLLQSPTSRNRHRGLSLHIPGAEVSQTITIDSATTTAAGAGSSLSVSDAFSHVRSPSAFLQRLINRSNAAAAGGTSSFNEVETPSSKHRISASVSISQSPVSLTSPRHVTSNSVDSPRISPTSLPSSSLALEDRDLNLTKQQLLSQLLPFTKAPVEIVPAFDPKYLKSL